VYCSERPSASADHVFAREFFLDHERADLPKVPACNQCNLKKSRLEHDLTTILPFGGKHEQALRNLKVMVPKRLAKNAKALRVLREGRHIVTVGGKPHSAVPFESESLEQLFAMIARGLIWEEWKTLVPPDVSIETAILNRQGEGIYSELFSVPGTRLCERRLAGNTFWYQGVQQKAQPVITAWRFHIYGALELTGDPDAPDEVASQILVITGIKNALANSV